MEILHQELYVLQSRQGMRGGEADWRAEKKQKQYNPPPTFYLSTHPLILVIICAKQQKNPSRIVHAVGWTWQDMPYSILAVLLRSHG